MSGSDKQITLYSHTTGPNPAKVRMILEELNITYTLKTLDFGKNEQKGPEFLKLNPNGRVPAIIDHANNDFTLWESGAIIEYLVDKYDTENKISFSNSGEDTVKYYQLKQWLYFQVSGQGPYFGQSAWFKVFHAEKLPSAIERYEKEVSRVIGVIDLHLKSTGSKYLVGNKCTYADIAFVPWNKNLDYLTGSDEWRKKNPNFAEWHASLLERPSVKKIIEEAAEAEKAAHGHLKK